MSTGLFSSMAEGVGTNWRTRLDYIVEAMREMSRQTDPQEMVRAYGVRMRQLFPRDRLIALSRRDLQDPWYRITRFSEWTEPLNPWTDRDRLPLLKGGLLGELIYGEEPRVIDEIELEPDDPAAEYLQGQRSLVALPNFDRGVATNMVIMASQDPGAFCVEMLPEQVWMSNLFGRATHNLVLSEQVKRAYDAVDHEMKIIADIQRSLLPSTLPKIPTLDLAAHYQTAHRAGGDYYDFYPLPDDKWGIFIADVSGHGAGAAVLMAITHSLAHSYPGPPTPPAAMLNYVNQRLASRYTLESGTFVTAFYGIYDPATRELCYCSAGHNPPRLKRCSDGAVLSLDASRNLPLGITPDEYYRESCHQLQPGDQVVFYTDGIIEASNAEGEMFGIERLDRALRQCRLDASQLIDSLLGSLDRFTAGLAPSDDRTIVLAKVS